MYLIPFFAKQMKINFFNESIPSADFDSMSQNETAFRDFVLESEMEFALDKGYLILSDAARARHNVSVLTVTLHTDRHCFGPRCATPLLSFSPTDVVVTPSFFLSWNVS